jgi:4-hydroxybutyrate dehydrogenase
MTPVLALPRLIFGSGSCSRLPEELASCGVHRPLLISDRGLERAGIVALIEKWLPAKSAQFLDVPENPTAAGADAACSLFRALGCDGVVAVGGGSVIDTAKIVVALVTSPVTCAAKLLGKPQLIGSEIPTLIAIPTTVGTGSESSTVAALHLEATGIGTGTRSVRLVPKVAICDASLTRTLPSRLVAATGIDALSHCIEGYFADPPHPIIDALALDGMARVFADIRTAIEPDGEQARSSLMAAAFAGGAAIQKGLGPAHAVALACSDQDLHHGTLIGVALPLTVGMAARHAPTKAARIADALDLDTGTDIAGALHALNQSLGLPTNLPQAGYRGGAVERLTDTMYQRPFNRTRPYSPTREQYRESTRTLL